MHTYLWAWGGEFIGYRDGDDLWSHDGRHIGRFNGDEAYAPNGRYLAEIMSENRLIVSISKKAWVHGSFGPWGSRAGMARFANYAGFAMYAGFEDFVLP